MGKETSGAHWERGILFFFTLHTPTYQKAERQATEAKTSETKVP